MYKRKFITKDVFKVDGIDLKDKKVSNFRAALGELASKLRGRITGFELRGDVFFVSFGKKDVAEGVSAELKKRGINAQEVSLIDEFFAEVASTTAK